MPSSDLTDPSLNYERLCGSPAHASAVPESRQASGVEVSHSSQHERVPVLHVINGEHYSGAERVQDLLAKCLPPCGFEVGIACVKPGRFSSERQTTSAPLFELPMKNKFDVGITKRLVQLVRRHSYRILHAHTPRTAVLTSLVSARCGVPMVYHVHSPTSRDCDRPWLNWVNNMVEWASLFKAQRVITVSHSLAEHMRQQGCSAELISVVPNGVPPLKNVVDRKPPGNKWVLGTVALFRPRKGIEVLLDAVATLRRRNFDVVLRAVGSFETSAYEAQLKNHSNRLGIDEHVCWAGFTRNVNAELSQMDLFVLPSLFGEGLPMVVLEAMAAGVPVVGTRVEGTPEVIRDGVDGVIVSPGDAEEMANKIAGVMRGKPGWRSLREQAIQRQAQCFSDVRMATGVADVYRQLLASD